MDAALHGWVAQKKLKAARFAPWWIPHASTVLRYCWHFILLPVYIRDTLGCAQVWRYCRYGHMVLRLLTLSWLLLWDSERRGRRREGKKSLWAEAAGAHKKRPSTKFCVPDLLPDSQSFTQPLDSLPCWAGLSSLLTFDQKSCINLYIAVFLFCVLLIQGCVRCGLDSHVLSHSFQKDVEKSEDSQKSQSSLIFL